MKNTETGIRKVVKGFMTLGMMLGLTFGVMVMESRSIGGALFPEDCDALNDGCETGPGFVVTNQCTTSGNPVFAECTKQNVGFGVSMEEFGEECEDISGTYNETRLAGGTTVVATCSRP